MTSKEQELKEAYEKQDKLCDELVRTNPLGYHDKEFDELIELKARWEGFQEGKAEGEKIVVQFLNEEIAKACKFGREQTLKEVEKIIDKWNSITTRHYYLDLDGKRKRKALRLHSDEINKLKAEIVKLKEVKK